MIIHERKTPYGYLTVEDPEPGVKGLFINGVSQGRVGKLWEPVSWYMKEMARRFPMYSERGMRRGLVIGGGAGILTRELELCDIVTDTIEISADVINVAQEYFDFDPEGKVIHGDAFKIVPTLEKNYYDVVILDVYLGSKQVADTNLFNQASDLVKPRGYFLGNGLDDSRHYVSELIYDSQN